MYTVGHVSPVCSNITLIQSFYGFSYTKIDIHVPCANVFPEANLPDKPMACIIRKLKMIRNLLFIEI